LELRPAARAVSDALRGHGRAALLYEGALRVHAVLMRPAGAWMAAYALRELLEELEVAAHVGAKEARLGDQVDALATVWQPTRDQVGALRAEPAMLEAVDQLLKRRAEDAPQRRARAALVIKGL
jgi:hypothetical protein